jgi:hypothetical protein
LVVKDGLALVGTAVERLRESVQYIHGSSACMDMFEKALVAVKININKKHPSKDVPTQWNATFLMIQSLIPCKLAFQQLEVDDNKYECCPSELKWKELLVMEKFLEPFYNGQLLILSICINDD